MTYPLSELNPGVMKRGRRREHNKKRKGPTPEKHKREKRHQHRQPDQSETGLDYDSGEEDSGEDFDTLGSVPIELRALASPYTGGRAAVAGGSGQEGTSQMAS